MSAVHPDQGGSLDPASHSGSGAGLPGERAIEILARFEPSAAADAPRGALFTQGGGPLAFAGWLDLMAIVEQVLEDERRAAAGEPTTRPAEPPSPGGPGPGAVP